MAVMKSIEHLIGKKFNRLTIVEDLGTRGSGQRYCRAICECGGEKKTRVTAILNGTASSCGCYRRECDKGFSKRYRTTHGLTKHPLHTVWNNMRNRCYWPNNSLYPDYGAIGVIVCAEWLNSFQPFFDWAMANGWRKGLQLDKDILYKKKHGTKTGLMYSPEYCSFVTAIENMRYRRNSKFIEYKNESKPINEWCEILNLNRSTVQGRFNLGWDAAKVFETPFLGRYKKQISA